MKLLPLETSFPQPLSDISSFKKGIEESGTLPEMKNLDADTASELHRWYGLYLAKKGNEAEAYTQLEGLSSNLHTKMDLHLHEASIFFIQMDEAIRNEENEKAISIGLDTLRALSQIEVKKNIDVQAILASTLYNLAIAHTASGATEHAEKELAKAQKMFEHLAKLDNDRFAAALLTTIDASTHIYKSRLKQINTLAHYQVATATYLDCMSSGVREAAKNLIESLKDQGDMLLKMGNYKESAKFYTKALKYQKKVSNSLQEKELRLSIDLGNALIHISSKHDIGINLLTSLIPLAERLGATAELEEINALLQTKAKLFDIMSIIKKLFILIIFISLSCSISAQQLVGHRGSIWGVENTRVSFINGARAGFQGLECDIKQTKDGGFVISHDDILGRLTPDSVSILKNNLEYLLKVPLQQVRFDGKYYEGHLCSLEQYLDVCREYNVFPLIEIKWCTNINSNNKNPQQYNYSGIPELMKLIEYKGMMDKVVFLTSMQGVLVELRKNYPSLKLQLLTSTKWEHLVDLCIANRFDIDARTDVENPKKLVETFHKNGLKVNVWCADTPEEYKKFSDLGVDYITTNFFTPSAKSEKK